MFRYNFSSLKEYSLGIMHYSFLYLFMKRNFLQQWIIPVHQKFLKSIFCCFFYESTNENKLSKDYEPTIQKLLAGFKFNGNKFRSILCYRSMPRFQLLSWKEELCLEKIMATNICNTNCSLTWKMQFLCWFMKMIQKVSYILTWKRKENLWLLYTIYSLWYTFQR